MICTCPDLIFHDPNKISNRRPSRTQTAALTRQNTPWISQIIRICYHVGQDVNFFELHLSKMVTDYISSGTTSLTYSTTLT